ncbi:MAG: beta-galactosidase [Planctomycetes bacterium]|nr:beta-galactosidase [Planctomycetota bacterium]
MNKPLGAMAAGLLLALLAAASGCRSRTAAMPAPTAEPAAPALDAPAAPLPTLALKLDGDRVSGGEALKGVLEGAWPGYRLRLLWVDAAGRVASAVEITPPEDTSRRVRFALNVTGEFGARQRIVALCGADLGPDREPPAWQPVAEASFTLLGAADAQDYAVWLTPSDKPIDAAWAAQLEAFPEAGLLAGGAGLPAPTPAHSPRARVAEILSAAEHPLSAPDRLAPAALDAMRRAMAAGIDAALAGGPNAFSLGDALTLPADESLAGSERAVFQAWLQRRYAKLESLNAAWETRFSAWAEVDAPDTSAAQAATQPRFAQRMAWLQAGDPDARLPRRDGRPYFELKPGELQAPGGENFTAWADRRAFDGFLFARLLKEYRAEAQRLAPGMPVGATGLSAPSAWGGLDYAALSDALDWFLPQRAGVQAALLEDLAPHARIWTPLDAGGARPARALWTAWLEGGHGLVLRGHGEQPALRDELGLLNAGLGTLARDWPRHRDAVAILYSPRSLAVHGMLDSALDGSEWRSRAGQDAARNSGARALEAWWMLLRDLGYAPSFVREEDVAAGKLTAKLLILPKVLCIGDETAEALLEYAHAGGIVLADAQCGLFDAYGKRRPLPPHDGPAGALDRAFGVQRVDYWSYELNGRLVGSADDARLQWLDPVSAQPRIPEDPDLRAVEPGVRAAGAWSFARARGGAAAMLSKRHGLGRLMYLNLSVQDYAVPPGGGNALRKIVGDLLEASLGAPAAAAVRELGVAPPALSAAQWRDGDASVFGLLGPAEGKPLVRIRAEGRRHWYDLRRGVYLGLQHTCDIAASPDRAALLAALPYRVQELLARVRRIDARGAFRLEVHLQTTSDGAQGSERPARHVVRLEIFAPNGQRLPHYARDLHLDAGEWKGELKLGLNEPPGEYRIVLTDVLSGQRAAAHAFKSHASFEQLFPVRTKELRWRLERDAGQTEIVLDEGFLRVRHELRLVPEGMGLAGAPQVVPEIPKPWRIDLRTPLAPERLAPVGTRPEPIPFTIVLSAPLKELPLAGGGIVRLRLDGGAPARDFTLPLPVALIPPRGEEGLQLDGVLDEKTWRGAPQIAGLVRADASPAEALSDVKLRHTPTHLIVGVECPEPDYARHRAAKVLAAADGDEALHDGEWFEIGLAAHAEDPPKRYRVDPAGHLWDASGEDAAWRGHARVKARERSDGWSLEIAIPWEDLGLDKPPTGGVLRLGLARRHAQSGGVAELSAWRMDAGVEVHAMGAAVAVGK